MEFADRRTGPRLTDPALSAWLENINRGDYFIDVGAHIGAFSLHAMAVGAVGIAVEPNPDVYHVLRRNVAINGFHQRCRTVEAALGSYRGQVDLLVGPDDKCATITNRRRAAGWDSVPVRMRTLDSLGGYKEHVLKVDVERAADYVLMGGLETLKYTRVIIIELLGEEKEPALGILDDADFKMTQLDRRNWIGTKIKRTRRSK